MSGTASLLAASQAGASDMAKVQEINSFKPQWEKYGATQANAKLLSFIELGAPTIKTVHLLQGNMPLLQALLDALHLQEEMPALWTLTLLHNVLREDSNGFNIIEAGLKAKIDIYKCLMILLDKKQGDVYFTDKTSWLLSAIMGHLPGYFSEQQVKSLLAFALKAGPKSDQALGSLDVIANLMKSPQYRSMVWACPGVPEYALDVPATAKPGHLYKSIFVMWLLSFDDDKVAVLKKCGAVAKIKECLVTSRVEKVVRICLTVLKNLLSHKQLCEEIAESNMLDAVRALEHEKWREEEFYNEILDMVQMIGAQVQEISNFERYEKELNTGKLTWGFVHTPKFFGENVMKFEQNDFKVLQKLKLLLSNQGTDPTTLAVACHDIGEFVALHPMGKKMISKFEMKEQIMELMACTGEDMRDVRREALLCCQKIMLNKWQEVDKK